jgi:hypothetical protein
VVAKTDFSAQDDALSAVMSACRYEMTAFESDVWTGLIEKTPRDRFLAFLQHHYSTSAFAPKPSDASKFLDRSLDPNLALLRLMDLVKELGPYQSPPVDDPVLVSAIHLMGGWIKVNEEMPDVSMDAQMRRFKERFLTCFEQAIVQVRINGEMPQVGLLSLPEKVAADRLEFSRQQQLLRLSNERSSA